MTEATAAADQSEPDINTARLMANVLERSQRLYEDGYRATVIGETAVQVTNPKNTVYTIDVQESACYCPFFKRHAGRLPCKHVLGWEKLLEDQSEAEQVQAQQVRALKEPFKECLFPLGRILMTAGVQEASLRHPDGPICLLPLLLRHSLGDWGEVDKEDGKANDRSVEDGTRLLSAYSLADGTKLWIITEADRSATTLLLPQEY